MLHACCPCQAALPVQFCHMMGDNDEKQKTDIFPLSIFFLHCLLASVIPTSSYENDWGKETSES